MSTIRQSNTVLIVGAGPTGLTLAHELLRRSVQIRLIDKAPGASQNTNIASDGSRWSGSGAANVHQSVTGREVNTYAESLLFVRFMVTQPTSYRLNAMFDVSGDSFGQMFLDGLGERFVDLFSGGGTPSFNVSGVLMPGQYEFFSVARAEPGFPGTGIGAASFAFDFATGDPAPVPEPGTLMLFATGVAALGRTALKRRQNRRLASPTQV